MNVKAIKLTNGDEIIAEVDGDLIKNPVYIMHAPSGQGQIQMVPYFTISKQREFSTDQLTVGIMKEPLDDLKSGYEDMMAEMNSKIITPNKQIITG